ncbi:MAG: hypothetical protein HFG09_00135 [Oscillibacter sp.]|nr:hypothetical protein [Oscillibacter sp.]
MEEIVCQFQLALGKKSNPAAVPLSGAIRFAGRPEMVHGMSGAFCGGAAVGVIQGSAKTRLHNFRDKGSWPAADQTPIFPFNRSPSAWRRAFSFSVVVSKKTCSNLALMTKKYVLLKNR